MATPPAPFRTFRRAGLLATPLMAGGPATGLIDAPAPPKRAPRPGRVVVPPPLRPAEHGPAPVPAYEPGLRHRSEAVLSRRQMVVWAALAALWAALNVTFWTWWLAPAHRGAPWLYWVQTVMMLYQVTLLPTIFWGFVARMRKLVELAPAPGLRVAIATLCVPAHESLQIIREQLEALVAVEADHDSWVLDEGASADVAALAAEMGVRYFTRRGVAHWNQPAPPFQAKTKAGNVNAWLDHLADLGEEYDVFVQMDIDHHPRADYLDRVLGYFRDEKVAWVQAPSVCGNLENWAARGLAEQDLIFQGPLQMGFYGHSRTPFIIGSHSAYRMSAIREIGGFQPTRAEDHLDTVVLASRGYEGVFVPELIAIGDGPHDFATYLRQQFAWAYSMIGIFINWTPRLMRRYTRAQAFQFLFAQSWYTMWSVSMALLWVLPAVALATGSPIGRVHIATYLAYFLPVPLCSSLMWCWTRRWFQPGGVRLSWRGVILQMARWPAVLWALINVVLRIEHPYMITPKGRPGQRGPSGAGLYGPYVALTVLSLGAMWAWALEHAHRAVAGLVVLALANAILCVAVLATTLGLELRARHRDGGEVLASVLRGRAWMLLITVLMAGAALVSGVHLWAPVAASLH